MTIKGELLTNMDIIAEYLGYEELCNALCKAMSIDDLEDILAYICRCYDIDNLPYEMHERS